MIYKFTITVGADTRVVHPIYKQDISKEIAKETGQQFFRETLSGSLKFVGADFEWIDAQPFETEFIVTIDKNKIGELPPTDMYWEGVFYKTDGKWDYDSGVVEMKVGPRDKYTEILANWENEYNLLDFSPERASVNIDKRPLLQVYIPGRSSIDNFLGGTTWEQVTNIEVTDVSLLTTKYKFSKNNNFFSATAIGENVIPREIIGGYMGLADTSQLIGPRVVDGGDNRYVLTYGISPHLSPIGGWTPFYDVAASIVREGVILFTTGGKKNYVEGQPFTLNANTAVPGTSGSLSITLHGKTETYQRVLLDKEMSYGENTRIPEDDIVASNRNFKYVRSLGNASIEVSTRVSIKPTKYGKRPDGLYFLPPKNPSAPLRVYFPLARANWDYGSVWFYFPEAWAAVEPDYIREFTMNDAFPLHNVLDSLVNMADTRLGFKDPADSTEYSHALNQIGELFITPKSNILAGQYSLAAQKAPATLKMFLDMLRDVYQIYWFIEDGKLRLENITWFKNGGSLSPTFAEIGIDLTMMKNTRNGKSWDFASDKIEFMKTEMPERYEFKWADDVSDAFEGYPIIVNSKFVERGKIETVAVSNFTTDIDYMLLTPETVGWDGFALFRAEKRTGPDDIWFYKVSYAQPEAGYSNLQNGHLSWVYIHENYWLGDLPSKNVNVNGRDLPGEEPWEQNKVKVQRNRTQKVSFPSLEDPNPVKLIKTGFGSRQFPPIYGQVQKINVSLHSRLVKVDLVYDTE